MLRSTLLIVAASVASAADRPELLKKMDARAEYYGNISRKIWELAEVGYKETKSSALLKDELRKAGFRVEEGIAGIPTAFIASWGEGKPGIGILAEYDALPGLSQQDVPQKQPRVEGAPGHGCGHNLLGSGSVFAAIEVRQYMQEHKLRGTLRLYGTPAEEGGSGKVFMARAGVFNGSDVALAWHPGDSNRANVSTNLATLTAKFRFRGTAAHAALAPEQGRSALDALLLMSHAVEMLREHVPQSTRMHYTINNGGASPNIVPDLAEGTFQARYPDMPTLDGIWQRIIKCAQAGALATETKLEMEIVSGSYNMLPNDTLAALYDKNLRVIGGVKYTPAETAFAESIRKTLSLAEALPMGSQESILPIASGVFYGSTDVGDVSWSIPTSELNVATLAPGVPLHSWQSTACTGMSIGRKGMMVAAKTLALTALDLLEDPKLIAAAKADFERRRAGNVYRSPIPAGQAPPLHYRDK
jgi:aminobenzoyl-glutamate utilization protein B